jgi:CheY-like chemotaxis protein
MTQHLVGNAQAQDTGAAAYVLVVDDDGVARDFFARCLEDEGYTVRKVGSAAEALEMMMDRPASLVLCDVKMPGQDGLWLADRLHTHWPQTKVIIATAVDDLETIRQSRERGAVDYVTKPVRPEVLLQVVRRAAVLANDRQPESDESTLSGPELQASSELKSDAEYTLENPVRCPACGERITTLKAVRLVRSQVNFTSTLPRRGRVMACPLCLSVIPAELTNF